MRNRGVMRRTVLMSALLSLGAFVGAEARDQKSVFRTLPSETGDLTGLGRAAEPISITSDWTYDGFRAPLAGDPGAHPSLLVAADRSGRVVALHPGDGRVLWQADLETPLTVGPLVTKTLVYQVTAAGVMHALDSAGAAERWRVELEGAPLAPPMMASGERLLVVTSTPEIVTLEATTGTLLARRALPGRPVAPTLDGDILILGTDLGRVLRLDPATLEVLWDRDLGHGVTAPPLIKDKRVYVAAANRSLRCLRLKSGREEWTQKTGSLTTARPLARGDFVYVLCYDNDIYVMRRRSGHLVGRVRLDHRLSQDAAPGREFLFVAPQTGGAVVGLEFPRLGEAGRFRLEIAGEWFTTAPSLLEGDRLAIGYGREAGRIMALKYAPLPEESPTPEAQGSR